MRIIQPIEPGSVYHIYNRGINSTDIFSEKKNYYYFLRQYQKYCTCILDTYCYALMKNHFHFLVRVNENAVVQRPDGKGETALKADKQLSHFFNSYAQAYNKAYKRHGGLFESPFRRVLVESDEYFTSLIHYIHLNPQHHGFVSDFKSWKFTSWHDLVGNGHTFLQRDDVMEWFGGKKSFLDFHDAYRGNNIDHLGF